MISPSEIEDQPVLLAYGIFAAGASSAGSFLCAAIAPALRYELEVRFKGAIRSDSPPTIRIEALGVEQTDIEEATVRCLALAKTCQQVGYPRGAQFATEILEQIENARLEAK